MLLKGEAVDLKKAKALNLVHAVVPAADMIKAAKDWIKGGGKAVAPWDEKGFKLPGGPVFSKMGMQMFPAGNAIYRRETYDNYPAARAIMQSRGRCSMRMPRRRPSVSICSTSDPDEPRPP